MAYAARTFRPLFFVVCKIIAVDELVVIIKIVVFIVKQLVVLFVRRLPFKQHLLGDFRLLAAAAALLCRRLFRQRGNNIIADNLLQIHQMPVIHMVAFFNHC